MVWILGRLNTLPKFKDRKIEISMISFTLKLPFFLHGLDFHLEEVEKLGGVGHPEHQRSKVRGELLDIRGTELTLWFCRAGHNTIHIVSC